MIQGMTNHPNNILSYNRKIHTKQNNEMNLIIEIKNNKLAFTCFYEKNYFKKTFTNSYTLEELKTISSYFEQFKQIRLVLNEIKGNQNKGQEYIEKDEENSDSINLIIPVPSTLNPKLIFELKEIKKTPEEISKEYKYVAKKYEYKFKIDNFDSKILIGKDTEKESIKSWISPNKKLKARLLYFFPDFSFSNGSVGEMKNNIGINETPTNFHNLCDNKKKILMLCKSNDQIFGGYTPLCFTSSNTYDYDDDSFLFSLNKFKTYPKNSFGKTKSIWCYQNYGPSFHYDLHFLEGKMNIINFSRANYLTPNNWVDIEKCKKIQMALFWIL